MKFKQALEALQAAPEFKGPPHKWLAKQKQDSSHSSHHVSCSSTTVVAK